MRLRRARSAASSWPVARSSWPCCACRASRSTLAEETVGDIRRATRRLFSVEEKMRIVLDSLRGEDSFAELCRKEGIGQNLY